MDVSRNHNVVTVLNLINLNFQDHIKFLPKNHTCSGLLAKVMPLPRDEFDGFTIKISFFD